MLHVIAQETHTLDTLQLAQPAAAICYDSYGAEQSTLPIAIERRLYRLQPRQNKENFASEDGKAFDIVFDAQPIDATAKLSAAAFPAPLPSTGLARVTH